MHKQLAVRGWVRLWEGALGCGYRNAQGTVIPQEPVKRVWYIEAVRAQYMESIEPQRPK